MIKFFKILLFPFAALYGVIMTLRNKLYDWKIFRQHQSPITSIVVGNLCAGGTGKTPHIEYIVKLLRDNHQIATLSRGYGRKTKGYILGTTESLSDDIGDEPRQFKQKFTNIPVSVCEDRVKGINHLLTDHPNLDTVLLDDAFQHRSHKPDFSIVLTDYYHLYTRDYMLPTGYLREPRKGANRADVIIVTKTPTVLSPIERKDIISELAPKPWQSVYFSYISYGELKPFSTTTLPLPSKITSVTLFAGIANPYPLIDHLKRKIQDVNFMSFPDHYEYKIEDIQKIQSEFKNLMTQNKIIITTEKDYMRLSKPEFHDILSTLPMYFVEIEIAFHGEDKQNFNQQILSHVEKNKRK